MIVTKFVSSIQSKAILVFDKLVRIFLFPRTSKVATNIIFVFKLYVDSNLQSLLTPLEACQFKTVLGSTSCDHFLHFQSKKFSPIPSTSFYLSIVLNAENDNAPVPCWRASSFCLKCDIFFFNPSGNLTLSNRLYCYVSASEISFTLVLITML